MTVLTLCRDQSTAVDESISGTITDTFGDIKRPEITPLMIEKIRTEKIIRIRQQLARGTYDLDERLDAVLERILADINT